MRKTKKNKNLTLVVALFLTVQMIICICGDNVVLANPHLDTPITNESDVMTGAPTNPERLQNTTLTIPEKIKEPPKKVFIEEKVDQDQLYYSYRQSLALFTGALIEATDTRDGDDYSDTSGLVFGISYLLPKPYSPHWEIEALFAYLQEGHLSLMKRFTRDEKSAFRWFTRYGLLIKIEAEEKLSTITNWENVLIRGGIGCESMKTPPGSHRYAIDVAAGLELSYIMFTYGYSWGW